MLIHASAPSWHVKEDIRSIGVKVRWSYTFPIADLEHLNGQTVFSFFLGYQSDWKGVYKMFRHSLGVLDLIIGFKANLLMHVVLAKKSVKKGPDAFKGFYNTTIDH